MLLSEKLSEAFNAQVNAEMWSSNLYLAMAVYFKKEGLDGFAHWMEKQSAEELEHAHDMINFCIDRGGDITIGQVNVVPTAWGNPTEVFEHVYKHETYVSELIDKMAHTFDFSELPAEEQQQWKNVQTAIQSLKEFLLGNIKPDENKEPLS